MSLLPNKNVLDGSKTPATSVAEMKAALGSIRDFLADLLGIDSADKAAARTALGVPADADVQAAKSVSAIASGTGDAMAIAMTPTLLAMVDMMEFHVRCSGANTVAAPTLTVDALPTMTIVAADGGPLPLGAYLDKWPATVRYRASTGKLELLNPVPIISTGKSTVRQTVLSGQADGSGYSNFIAAGSGLSLNLAAATVPLVLSFAGGFDATGEVNYLTRLTADVSGVVSALAASNVTYVYADYVSPTAVTWGKSLAPVQYGQSYNKAAQALLQFEGASGSTVFFDDFGNVWSAQGNAKIQTTQKKFGSAALGGAGASNALNGSSDYVRCSGITTLGNGGWTLRADGYLTDLSSARGLFSAANAGSYGASVQITTAGKTKVSLSSSGASFDIASGTLGSATLVVGQFYTIELTFDAVAGKYFVYVNGVIDQTITSGLRICPFTNLYVGADFTGISYWAGYIDNFEFLPYCQHPAGSTHSLPPSAPSITAVGYASDFFNIAEMKMYKVAGASTTAGVNPSFANINRLYVGEATGGVGSISSIVSYAMRGQYDSGWFPLSTSALHTKNHNIGVTPLVQRSWGSADAAGAVAGDWMLNLYVGGSAAVGGAWTANPTRNTIAIETDSIPRFVANNTYLSATYGRIVANRGF
ncbi:LamG-like jellyroll fold domain-containing protein [Herbaspirillum sp. NPDC101396]|uniref:LamG-like jellyroll fold domain-containing protein n=1 Tax=Herbaspirillum sp. NPDC101396 TaxID=3364005 RepID=UPI00383A2354